MSENNLRTVMTPLPITLTRNDCLDKVADIFNQHKIHHLPVVDEAGQLSGMLSKTDFDRLQHGATLFRIPDREAYNKTLFQITRVADVMTKDVVALSPFDTIGKAYTIFKKNILRAIPLQEKGKLVGIVTPLDLLDYFMQKEAKKND